MSKITCCTDEKRLRVYVQNVPVLYRHRAHMLKHVCAWCWHTRASFERTHGDVLSGHTEFFSVSHTTHHTAHTPQHKHNTTTRPQHHTEKKRQKQTETDRQRQTETKKEDRDRDTREDGRGETRQEKRRQEKTRQDKNAREDKTREERRVKIHFQCGGVWPFFVHGVLCLVKPSTPDSLAC